MRNIAHFLLSSRIVPKAVIDLSVDRAAEKMVKTGRKVAEIMFADRYRQTNIR